MAVARERATSSALAFGYARDTGVGPSQLGGPRGPNGSHHRGLDRREFPFFRLPRSIGRPSTGGAGRWRRQKFLLANELGRNARLTSVRRDAKRVPRTRGKLAVWPDTTWHNAQTDRNNLEFCAKAQAISAAVATFEWHILADSSFFQDVCEAMSLFHGDFSHIDLSLSLFLKESPGRNHFSNGFGPKLKKLSRPTPLPCPPPSVETPHLRSCSPTTHCRPARSLSARRGGLKGVSEMT